MNDDRETLRNQAYATASKLRARQHLWTFVDRVWDEGRIAAACSLRGDETVVDIGCGNGNDLRALRGNGHLGDCIAVDFSPGMLADVEPEMADRIVADAMSLPLPAASADVVCAMHMLYHVPDIPTVLREARRVLRPDGVFLASTNSEHAARELIEPWSAALVAAGGPSLTRVSHVAFSMENGGAILSEVFADVDIFMMEVTAKVPDASVVRDYVASTDDLYQPMLRDPALWTQVLDDVEAHAAAAIAERGTFDITQRAGIFICRG